MPVKFVILLGGDYYLDFADDNHADGKKAGLGDIIAYHNETTVDWLGYFAQGNYTAGAISAYGMAGILVHCIHLPRPFYSCDKL